ncbi:MAG: hypothetical protein AB1486_02715 [Planctomycetota bacterium]
MTKRWRRASLILPVLALLGLSFFAGTGCQTYTPYSFGEHVNNHFKVWGRDFMKIAKSLDYHFLNYDWDDPWID